MRRYASMFMLSAMMLSTGSAMAQNTNEPGVTVSKSGDRQTTRTPEQYFTGRVWLDPLFLQLPAPQRLTGSLVTFEPGARSAWHTHPVGQTLYITAGNGWVQEWGQAKIFVQTGDVVNFLPGVKHWHGATATSSMSHIAVQEVDDNGKNVDWLEKSLMSNITTGNEVKHET